MTTLYYFDIYGRGEVVRVFLTAHGIPFEDKRIQFQEWPDQKKNFEFHQVPALDLDNMKLVQTVSMCRYISQTRGTYPSDQFAIYLSESTVDLVEDIRKGMGKYRAAKDEEGLQKWLQENLPNFLRLLEQRLQQSAFFMGESPGYPDLYVFSYTDVQCMREGQDQYREMLEQHAPSLKQHQEKVLEHFPSLREYISNRPQRPF
mmetsp:Transcript_5065/g.7645  ORF Transcript_5065/g.7645 Transcript_5065/m.7645 type:complete len:203 (-) Transcript_5065:1867-2475(-)